MSCHRDRLETPEGPCVKILKTLKSELLQDPQTQQAYEALADEFDMTRQLIEARTRARMTQGEVAEKMGATQKRDCPFGKWQAAALATDGAAVCRSGGWALGGPD